MYASVPENGGGFFEGVCTLSNATADLRDPPPPPLDSPTALCQPCSKSNMGVYIRAFYFLELARIGSLHFILVDSPSD